MVQVAGLAGLMLLALGTCATGRAQQATQTPATNAAMAADVLHEPYRLGRGDVVSIVVENRPEISSKQPVGPDGCVTVALVGSVSVVDLTREEAAAKIKAGLQPYYTTLSVGVSVDAYGSNKVLLLGAVQNPGPQTFDSPPTLLEVLSKGGGVARSNGSNLQGRVNLTGGGGGAMPDKAVIYRGKETVLWVDVRKMLTSGTTMGDIHLRRDDVVYVPSGSDRTVSVMGQVQQPGNVPLDDGKTLQALIADAGGFTERAGKNATIRIIEPGTGKTQVLNFGDVLKGKQLEVKLVPGDLIFVQTSGFNSFGYAVQQLSPLVNAFTTGFIAAK